MSNIRLLDVTLRDGGIVNDFNFGTKNMTSILNAIEDCKITNIELGYLEKTKGSEEGRSQFINEKVIYKNFLKNKKPGVKYYAMFDYSKFDADSLEDRHESGIDCIRFAFHKRNFKEAIATYQTIIDKGYEVYMQPMVTLHYSDEELEMLINEANKLDIKGIYFVDTFGQMVPSDVVRLAKFFDERLRKDIALGFHAHNNIQLAYANAIAFIDMPMEREKMLDSSILGIGRGAGNLNTELIISYLNKHNNESYNLNPILNVIDDVMLDINKDFAWGYSIEYLLSSLNDCSPIFAKHYLNEHNVSIENLNKILSMVEGENRISFKKDYADSVIDKFNNK